MSKKHKKVSREKDESSDKKKNETAEIESKLVKEQPSQRLAGNTEHMKTKSCLDLRDTKGLQEDISTDRRKACSALVPPVVHGKVIMHFKNKAQPVGKRSHMDSAVAFSSKECSDKNMCVDPDTERRKVESLQLKILNNRRKNKMKTKVKHSGLKEVIKKSLLEKLKETTLPVNSSSHHKEKTLKSCELRRKQGISEEPYSSFSAFNFSSLKSPTQAFRNTSERTKHISPELPSKNDKEMQAPPLTEPSKCWKYKQKRPLPTESTKDIGNPRILGNKSKPVAFHTTQSAEASCSSCEAIEDADEDQEMQIVEDLHAARIDNKMALPVVQTCGELTSMEIDLRDDESNMSFRSLSGLNTLIVVDTNIMIRHLEYIKFLKNRVIPGIGRFVLVIPWVVLQELDNLKKGKILANVGQRAIPAVNFIYVCLKNQDPKLWGQSMQLASEKTDGFSVRNNDDRVLQCCLQYQSLFPQAEVVLLTDDKNLCNKALVSEVRAFSKADFVTALQKLTGEAVAVNQDNSCSWMKSNKASAKQEVNKDSKKMENSTEPLSQIILESQKCLGEVLSSILVTELKIAYGDLWTEVVYHKPPWTLANVLECYKKHWVAVFGMVISRSFLSTVEYLYTHLCKAKIIQQSTMKVVLQESKMLLETFRSRSNYDGVLLQALSQIDRLLQTLEKIQSDTGPNSSDTFKSTSGSAACEKMEDVPLATQAEDKSPKPLTQADRHQEIWSVLESIWNTMNRFSLEVFQKLDLNTVTTPQDMAAFKEAFLGLQKLMVAVNEILAAIRQVLITNSSFQDVLPLYSFLTNHEINNSIKFSAEELQNCVSQEVYRSQLSIGCGQLVQLEHTVKQCYESVCAEISSRGWF
ncbi:transcriptional protein SWT1 isoform X2 [Varanus komodoensis]|uniref:Transcriptional protein SWT1 n=1 Tax=Varanus komodoensis TaxID=61221 RepID=A0A8D2J4E1_VARKO|nr:transcriptional protein SWT1 isoform X2 [Varanus komodoensis]